MFPCGTFEFMAPELFTRTADDFDYQTPKVDVWSLFITLTSIHKQAEWNPPRRRIQKLCAVHFACDELCCVLKEECDEYFKQPERILVLFYMNVYLGIS